MNRITEVTRLRILDGLTQVGALWFGRLDDVRFLRRLYDLSALPSEDPRFTTAEQDIVQHRVRNDDWEDNWVFQDARLGLADGTDEVLLAFLVEMLNPVVRSDRGEVERLLAVFNDALAYDGYTIVETGQISGAPVYGYRATGADRSIFPTAPSGAAAAIPTAPATSEGEREQALISSYGQLRFDEVEDRADGLLDVLVDVITMDGGRPRKLTQSLIEGSRALGVELDGASYIIDVLWPETPVDIGLLEQVARAAAGRSSRTPRVVLCGSGFTPEIVAGASDRESGGCALLDASHLEAMLCRLVSPSLVLDQVHKQIEFAGRAFTALADLVAGEAPAPARMWTPDKQPAPWTVNDKPSGAASISVGLVGDPGWEQPSGLSAGPPGHVFVTVDSGVLDLDTRRGTTSWLVFVPGCHGPALRTPDGRILVACGRAVIEAEGTSIRAVAGAFDLSARLVPGDDGEVWVLAGANVVHDLHDERSISLTRIGRGVGDQLTRQIVFPAAVRSAVSLGRHRFFLAASGHSAVVDLDRSSRVSRSAWLESAGSYPANSVRDFAGNIVTASGTGTGTRVLVHRTDPENGAAELLADLALNRVDGLAEDGASGVYLLGDVRGNGPDPRPLLLHLRFAHAPAQVAAPGASAASDQHDYLEPYDVVLAAACGNRRDYALDNRPLDDGGQGAVFRAEHKPSGLFVAFKKRSSGLDAAVARMRREIEFGRQFGEDPHVMPVLDADANASWFTMPLAEGTAETLALALQAPDELRAMVTAVCGALSLAHGFGWIHRDIKPANILRLDGRWVLADWGLGRRARGQTTFPGRTKVGVTYGTEGFAAPELSIDAHQADGRADIYSIGQVIGWALTRKWPQANVPLMPATGSWRHIVREATRLEPDHRPADIAALLELIHIELDPAAEEPASVGERLLAEAKAGRGRAIGELLDLASRHPASYELYVEILLGLDPQALAAELVAIPQRGRDVVRAMNAQTPGPSVVMEYWQVDRIIRLMLAVARAAEAEALWELVEEAASGLAERDADWDRWDVQKDISTWLREITGDAASIAASSLRRYPKSAQHFAHLANDRHVDPRVRSALAASGGTDD
ncbi:protein kinase domain-containing protein [Actinospica robiniae]|uniref:AbiJ-related protein n=1 Tax=Actinospica robiniae TaxID=304901 RepID=UPI000426C185|nr:hypothetical protein [Actinospica robiniae]